MIKITKKLSIAQWLVVIAITIFIINLGLNFLKNKVVVSNFFKNYNVLTVMGDDSFSYNGISINGKIIEKNKEGWTNVLPISDSLQYVTLTSSYSKSKDIQCGDKIIPKKVEQYYDGENEWCITHNSSNYVSITSAVYYPYDEENIVYETCLSNKYYEGVDGTNGFNGCADRALFLNSEKIANTKESYSLNSLSGKLALEEAKSFNYYPSKKIDSKIFYSTNSATYSYDILTKETEILNTNIDYRLNDIFITNEGNQILVKENSPVEDSYFLLGSIVYSGHEYKQVYSSNYIDDNLYLLRLTDVQDQEKSRMGKILYFELIKNGKKIENIEIEQAGTYGYRDEAIREFPYCVHDTIVCVYEDNHYAYKKKTLAPDVFGYNFYTEEMVIDGKWLGDNIPNFIGRSKPIFENDKLKYIVYEDLSGNGLYLIDFDKKWNFKDLYLKKGSATTKLLNGNQNKLLNVLKK